MRGLGFHMDQNKMDYRENKTPSGGKEHAMVTTAATKRPIGRILLDGGFLSPRDLELALEEQKHTNDLLGQVLVRMGVLNPTDIGVVLAIQEHLGRAEDAIKTAAGVRQMLGDLLIQAGHISVEQLDLAIAEQRKTGEKLGVIFVKLGMLTEAQLNGVLDFQRNQGGEKPAPNPLRLGEILVTTGAISREQLDHALLKQTLSGKRLGEVLVEEGYAQPHHITYGIRMQRMLLTAALVALLTACGAGGGTTGTSGDAAVSAVSSSTSQQSPLSSGNYFAVTSDDYGLMKPNFYYSTDNSSFWSIQSSVAKDVNDLEYRTVLRVDIPKTDGAMPDINKTFSIEDGAQYDKFPGVFLVFNGQKSIYKKVEQGTITFSADSNASGNVSGTFDVIMVDYDATVFPAPQYHLKGEFNFKMGTYGPAPVPAGAVS